MGANEKHAATYHGVSHNPDTDLVRTVYAGASPVPSYEDRETAFDRWLETVRAEAKAEALEDMANVLEGQIPSTSHESGQIIAGRHIIRIIRARANQYKENLK